MEPHKGLVKHEPPHSYGDCMRTAIACLLEVHPLDVPHWYEDGLAWEDDDGFSIQHGKMKQWLHDQGLLLIGHAYKCDDEVFPLENVLLNMAVLNPDEFYILAGESKTGCAHVVICQNDEIIWDPSPGNPGIIGPQPHDGYYHVEFLARRLIDA